MRALNLAVALLVFANGCGGESSSTTSKEDGPSSEQVAEQVAELCHQVLSEAQPEPDRPLMSEEACTEKMLLIHTELSPSGWKGFQTAIRHVNPTELEPMMDTTLEMAESGELER